MFHTKLWDRTSRLFQKLLLVNFYFVHSQITQSWLESIEGKDLSKSRCFSLDFGHFSHRNFNAPLLLTKIGPASLLYAGHMYHYMVACWTRSLLQPEKKKNISFQHTKTIEKKSVEPFLKKKKNVPVTPPTPRYGSLVLTATQWKTDHSCCPLSAEVS